MHEWVNWHACGCGWASGEWIDVYKRCIEIPLTSCHVHAPIVLAA